MIISKTQLKSLPNISQNKPTLHKVDLTKANKLKQRKLEAIEVEDLTEAELQKKRGPAVPRKTQVVLQNSNKSSSKEGNVKGFCET